MESYGTTLGERIRRLRIKRGLTQKTLAGEHMTRNMLSLIENGTALPSLPSLLYLAKMLEMPVDYFFSSTEEEEGRYYKLSVITQLKELFEAANHRECLQLIQSLPDASIDDEVAYIAAESHIHTALSYAHAYEMRSALLQLKTASDAMQKTIYAADDMKKAITYYRDLFTIISQTAEIPERLTDLRYASRFVPAEMLLYLSALRSLGKNPVLHIPRELGKDSPPARHLQALAALYNNRWDTAVRILRELSQDGALPYYMRYRVLTDLEEAAGNTGEYRIAYMSARKKLDLLECVKK